MLVIYTDGASFGNPGSMGIGIVIYKDGMRVEELSEYIGEGTNNIAEYTAVIKALETAHQMGETMVHIKSDSQLVIRQLNNEYKVKDIKLKPLSKRVASLIIGMEVHFEHIPREKNTEADKLSKQGAELGKRK
ncbi:ribonuclease HI family protein [Candidatus Micrarchaeota archaeon]|nr:ribonuclease HI family protein [Candidatus Micrarchaeota archaeon]MBU1166027.1 ribonuclease HI family protein [Candidatus Micrarchaeota archaeon]MBU1886358.1 ribonuclease HI family protein [Candidatus Micrarchaeota archaeon]